MTSRTDIPSILDRFLDLDLPVDPAETKSRQRRKTALRADSKSTPETGAPACRFTAAAEEEMAVTYSHRPLFEDTETDRPKYQALIARLKTIKDRIGEPAV